MVVLQLRWLSLGASRLSQMPGSNPPTTLGRVPQPLPASACWSATWEQWDLPGSCCGNSEGWAGLLGAVMHLALFGH